MAIAERNGRDLMLGVNLLNSIEPAESGLIVTGCARGTTGGRLWRLELRGRRSVDNKVESTSEQILGDTHLKNYALGELDSGIYKVESHLSGLLFLRLGQDGELEVLKNERSAWKELERHR